MERFRYRGPESVHKTLKYGQKMSMVRKPVTFGPSGLTAKHESDHVVAAGVIESSTIIPQGDALGVTKPAKMTAVAAAGAAAMGHDGTSWDQFVTEHFLGIPFEQAKAAARATLAGKELEREAVAATLQRKGTIFQADVDEAYRQADKARKGIAAVEIVLIDHRGKMTQQHVETAKTTGQIVDEMEQELQKMILDELVGV